jgi:hypothetical protein
MMAGTVAVGAATPVVNASSVYNVGTGDITVTTNITGASAGTQLAYLVTSGGDSDTPSDSNILYIDQYEIEEGGSKTIVYKISKSKLDTLGTYKSTVRFGSAADTYTTPTDNLLLDRYSIIYDNPSNPTYASIRPASGYEIDTIKIDGVSVATDKLTYSVTSSSTIEVTTKALDTAKSHEGAGMIAAAIKTSVNNASERSVSYLLQPCAGANITEMGLKYGNLLFPSLATVDGGNAVSGAAAYKGVTKVKLVFTDVMDTEEFSSVVVNPYYISGDDSKVYSVSGTAVIDLGALEE